LLDIFDAMMERKVSTGEEIIRQGDEGDFFYVVDSGHFDILVLFSEPLSTYHSLPSS